MANPWFRVYSEIQDDPKIQMLPEHMRWRWISLLCSRCKGEHLSDRTIAFQWRVPPEDVQETKTVFLAQGLIDSAWKVLRWEDRQYLSDSSKERTRQYRERKFGDGPVTSQGSHNGRHGDLPRTDTESEQINAPVKRYFDE